jgi:Fe-S-cluster containining protein
MNNNKCRIQNVKPLDCLCYPLKAVYKGNSIAFIVDINCPANEFLNDKFLQEAKKIAVSSIQRFDRETYTHWLSNYVGWVGKTAKILTATNKNY